MQSAQCGNLLEYKPTPRKNHEAADTESIGTEIERIWWTIRLSGRSNRRILARKHNFR